MKSLSLAFSTPTSLNEWDILLASTPDFHPAPLALDVTIRCPDARHVLSSAALQSSMVPNRGEKQKIGYCKTDCRMEGWDILSLFFRFVRNPRLPDRTTFNDVGAGHRVQI